MKMNAFPGLIPRSSAVDPRPRLKFPKNWPRPIILELKTRKGPNIFDKKMRSEKDVSGKMLRVGSRRKNSTGHK